MGQKDKNCCHFNSHFSASNFSVVGKALLIRSGALLAATDDKARRLLNFFEEMVAQTLLEDILAHWQNTACYPLEKALAQFDVGADTSLAVESEILHGNPRKVILEEAEKWGADLIVLGSHGMSGIERFLLGSVSQAVAMHAKCSVEIVRPRFAIERQETAPTVWTPVIEAISNYET